MNSMHQVLGGIWRFQIAVKGNKSLQKNKNVGKVYCNMKLEAVKGHVTLKNDNLDIFITCNNYPSQVNLDGFRQENPSDS